MCAILNTGSSLSIDKGITGAAMSAPMFSPFFLIQDLLFMLRVIIAIQKSVAGWGLVLLVFAVWAGSNIADQ